MELKRVKYTKDKKPYVEFKITSGTKKGYVTRRFGKILTCPACNKEYFARDEQLKKGSGKFCSVKCAKVSAKEERREEELASRQSKKIKNQVVYFGDDDKIYTEKKDKKAKVYRYYGQIKKCLVCGEDFFANFSQIKLDRAKYCSRLCVKKAQRGEEKVPVAAEEKVPLTVTEEEVKTVKMDFVAPVPPEEIKSASQEERAIPQEKILRREPIYRYRREEKVKEEQPVGAHDRPIGILVFGIVIIYIGLFHLVSALRFSNTIEAQYKDYILLAINLLLGFGILMRTSWAIKLLYAYLALVSGFAMTIGYFTIFIEPALKTIAFLKGFLVELGFAFIPHLFALAYLARPDIKELFR